VRVHCVAYPGVTRHADNVKSYIEDIQGDYAKAKRARGYFDYHLKHAADLRKALCEYVKDFSKEIRKSFKGPERKTLQMLLDLKWMPFPAKEIKERTAKARAFRKKSQEVRSTLLKAQIEAAKKDDQERQAETEAAFQAWKCGEPTNGYKYFYDFPLTLRVHGGEIQTSLGATIPVKVAVRFWERYQAGQNIAGFDFGYYKADGLENNILTVGCHKIPVSEIERMAQVLGLATNGGRP
jgi:hypothetical protein